MLQFSALSLYKNILVLDDVFSSGTTISQAVKAIKQNYNPKSITVVTL